MNSKGDHSIEKIRQQLSALRTLLVTPGVDDNERWEQALLHIEALETNLVRFKADAAHSHSRLGETSAMLTALAGLDYSQRMTITERNDAYDGLGVFLNMLAEELSASTVSKGYLEQIIESMTNMVLVFDTKGILRMVNTAVTEFCGYRRDELVNQSISMLFSDVELAEVVDNGSAYIEETRCKTKAGITRAVSFLTSIMRNRKGDIEGIVGVACDLTEHKRAEEERLQLEGVMQRQSILLEELSTPLIPVTDEIVIMPLVGSLDQDRMRSMCETLFEGIIKRRTAVVIIDMTGLRTVDESVTQAMIRVGYGARLLGTEVVLTGIQSGVAGAMVRLEAELQGIQTSRSLQSAIARALSDH